ncbi:MAG: HEPN domain-containing protein [Lachnospiraceae bacterium]|nr:HEPN domain-containing protein [Lachnospiraceae bacterium]
MESAEEHLKASKLLVDAGLLKDSIGRSYYAMFAATRALLALEGFVQ